MSLSEDEIDAESLSKLFRDRGFFVTANWINFATSSKMQDFLLNFDDTLKSLRIEMANYKREYYDNPSIKKEWFDWILHIVLGGMTVGAKRFSKLTGDLIPVMQRKIESTKAIGEILSFVENLKGKQRFYMLCFCYLILFEGNFKGVLKTLLAMKRLKEGKHVNISNALQVITDKSLESSFHEVTPNNLSDIHWHLRNSIAHAYFIYLEKKDKMRLWDIHPRKNQYSMKPIELDYKDFSRYVAEIQIFCDIYGFLVLFFIAFQDIMKRQRL